MMYFPHHPQAINAVWLARHLAGAHPDRITAILAMSECPRRLFVLAATLQASVEQGANPYATGTQVSATLDKVNTRPSRISQ